MVALYRYTWDVTNPGRVLYAEGNKVHKTLLSNGTVNLTPLEGWRFRLTLLACSQHMALKFEHDHAVMLRLSPEHF